mmetsp:Transcript_14066/g.31082  ORF Transcript_14066/g.31082 Transcript_14066/m.31082 type:complete len:156 (-) Transcript_14066:39-506(-)
MMDHKVLHRPSLSSLHFQVSLYYGALFSIIFAILVGSGSVQKYVYFNKRVAISVISLWCVIEPARLWFGIKGNLRENVSDLATFLLITLFPQMPFALYFAYIQPVLFPVDPIVGTLMVLFLLFHFVSGLSMLRLVIRNQTAQFMRLCENDEVDEE